MDFGVSNACFYPVETEKALKLIGELGIKKTEVFLNSPSEMESEILNELIRIKNGYGIDVVSVHPFTSGCEPFFLFSEYERRFYDTLDLYRRYMNTCNELGAKILVIHGSRVNMRISEEEYFERFGKLFDIGKSMGVIVAQENVFDYVSGSPEFLKRMKKYLKDKFKLVFDIKQSRRCSHNVDDFLDELIDDIVHIHISDNNATETCLPPGEGNFDFESFLKRMNEAKYNGCCLIELYRKNYKEYSQLKDSYDYLCNLKKKLNIS